MNRIVVRRGFTLVEVLVAFAILVTVLVSTYGLVVQGFQSGADLPRRETADMLGRNLLDRFARLPGANLDRVFKRSGSVDLDGWEDETLDAGNPADAAALEAAGFKRKLSFEKLPGDRPAAALHATVSWPGPNGAERSMTFSRTMFPIDGAGTALENSAGFKHQGSVGWGRRSEWRAPPAASVAGFAKSVRSDPAQLVDQAAWQAATPTESGARTFSGDPALVAKLLGPNGELSRPQGDPAAVAHHRTLRHEARFLTSVGVPQARWPADVRGSAKMFEKVSASGRPAALAKSITCCAGDAGFSRVPDGIYPYRLEAETFRDPKGGATLGVYVLQLSGAGPYRLVARSTLLPRPERQMEGDVVVEEKAFITELKSTAILKRTDERLYLIGLGSTPEQRTLRIQTLTGDPGDAAVAEAAVAELVRKARLSPGGPAIDDLAIASASRDPEGAAPAAAPAFAAPAAPAVVQLAARASTEPGTLRETAVRFRSRVLLARADAPGAEPDLLSTPGADAASTTGAPSASYGAPDAADRVVREAQELAVSDPARARGLLDDRLADRPDDADALALRGRLRAAAGEAQGAIDDLTIAARIRPGDVSLARDLAGLMLKTGHPEAGAMVDRLAALAPSDPSIDTLRSSLVLMNTAAAMAAQQSAPGAIAAAAAPGAGGATAAGGAGATAIPGGAVASGSGAGSGTGTGTGTGGGGAGGANVGGGPPATAAGATPAKRKVIAEMSGDWGSVSFEQ